MDKGLITSIKKGHLDACRIWTDHYPDKINIQNEDGNTVLHLAVKHKQYRIAQHLIFSGATTTIRNNFEKTPLGISRDKNISHLLSKSNDLLHIVKILNKHFPNPTPPLNHTNAFTFLVAVLLSAQTTDERVNIITPALFELADTPQKMSKLSISDVEELIKTCGLYKTKAKHIIELSKILIIKYDGVIPHDRDLLTQLPGVGQKTAGVFIAQKTDGDAFPVDTHIIRCAHRWKLSTHKNPNHVESDLQLLFPQYLWNTLHLQIIYYARKYSPAKKFNPTTCQIQSYFNNTK